MLVSLAADESIKSLEATPNKDAKSIVRRVRNLRVVLLEDCLHGEAVRKDAIPVALVHKYGIENLFVEDLPSFWRLLYTIVHEGTNRVIVVLEIVDHRKHDRWFPGRGR